MTDAPRWIRVHVGDRHTDLEIRAGETFSEAFDRGVVLTIDTFGIPETVYSSRLIAGGVRSERIDAPYDDWEATT